jgi:hypothetical protein
VAEACLRSIWLLRLRGVRLLLHAASPVCLALPVSFAAGRDVRSEKRSTRRKGDIEDVIASMQRTISVAPKPPPFRSHRLPPSNWARPSRTPAKIADKLKKRPHLGKARLEVCKAVLPKNNADNESMTCSALSPASFVGGGSLLCARSIYTGF